MICWVLFGVTIAFPGSWFDNEVRKLYTEAMKMLSGSWAGVSWRWRVGLPRDRCPFLFSETAHRRRIARVATSVLTWELI